MSMETFSERSDAVQPVPLRQEEIPTVEMPIIEINPDLRTDDDFKGEASLILATPSSSFFKAWWQKLSAYFSGHLV